jgi:hypothetical protein
VYNISQLIILERTPKMAKIYETLSNNIVHKSIPECHVSSTTRNYAMLPRIVSQHISLRKIQLCEKLI